MQKKTKNVIASVLALVGRPSDQKLSRKDLRLLIHNAVEKFTARAIKEQEDWWTHIDDATVTYATDNNYYTFTLPSSVTEYSPMYVWYQPTTANRNTGDWYQASIVPLDAFPQESGKGRVVLSFYGNNFDGIGAMRVVSNMTSGYAEKMRWRVQYRRISLVAPAYDGLVPFPAEYISLIEYSVAEEALTFIVDDSPKFAGFFSRRMPSLEKRRLELELDFMDSIKRDPKARIIRAVPYNYKNSGSRNTRISLKVETQ